MTTTLQERIAAYKKAREKATQALMIVEYNEVLGEKLDGTNNCFVANFNSRHGNGPADAEFFAWACNESVAIITDLEAENLRLRHLQRWNIEPNPDGSVSVCKGLHEKLTACRFERYIPEPPKDA